MNPVIHWFRRDLRLGDNLALQAALHSGNPVIPLFIFDNAILKSKRSGAPPMAFLLKSLESLDESLQKHQGRLVIRRGDPVEILANMIAETGAQTLYFNRDYTPFARRRDEAIQYLRVEIRAFDDSVLIAPGEVVKQDGNPFMVYTPFKKQWKTQPKPEKVEFRSGTFLTVNGQDLPNLHELGFAEAIDLPEASEAEARRRLDAFIDAPIYTYSETRNHLSLDPFSDARMETSYLSPYLRFGMLSPRQAYWAAHEAYQRTDDQKERDSVETWVDEMIWREFYVHVMAHFPHVDKSSFRPEYDRVDWRDAPDELQAWKDGLTGYPVVDAAMRQLKAIGWMPNRARMIVASFLTKDLLIDWREGELHFMQHLIDGDPAANNGGWQWTAGTGTDAQPYFRIFNPVSQSRKFDPDGYYIRMWIPELADVPDGFVHTPWEMDTPPEQYPPPIIDHEFARERTLAAYKAVKK
jgi:deoxyribodipyrimidine photo-lyase